MFRFSKSDNPNFAQLYKKAENLYNDLPLVKKIRKRQMFYRSIKYISSIILILGLVIIIIFGAHFFSIKAIYTEAVGGKFYLEQALGSAKAQDFDQAIVFANQAENNFDQAVSNLSEIQNSFIIGHIPILRSQVNDVTNLVDSTKILSRSVSQAAGFGKELKSLLDSDKKLTYSTFSPQEKKRILGKIYRSAPELTGMKANLDLALLNLNQINYWGILMPFQGKIQDIKSKVEQGSLLLSKAVPMSQILPVFAGYPEKSTYLVLFQNNDELRPTGGFLGTYGILETEYGDINRFETHDIYHIDMPVKDKVSVTPPEPIKQYLNPKWYMRDANWSPDWPTSAKQIEWFYDTENNLLTGKDQINNFNGKFNGVIAITPKFVTDLLSLVGPITIDGEEYNENNFVELLQYQVEKGYAQAGTPSWQRKEVIGNILKELKIRLMNLPANDWQTVINIFDNNISKKNILAYLNDESLEKLIIEQGWGGEIKNMDGDYVAVFDSNMAALKTDAVMNRNIDYSITQTDEGLIAKLTINYAHRGHTDWKTSRYQTYTRVYVPKGSILISALGYSKGNVAVQDELGKTSFGCYLTVEPDSVSTLTLVYKLPAQITRTTDAGKYSLYIQKQPGNDVSQLTVDAKFKNIIKSYQPVGFSVDRVAGQQINWSTDLTMDRSFDISL